MSGATEDRVRQQHVEAVEIRTDRRVLREDDQLAAAISYVRTAWGNKAKPVTPAEVAKVRLALRAAPKAKGLQAH